MRQLASPLLGLACALGASCSTPPTKIVFGPPPACDSCHDLAALEQPEPAGKGPRGWMLGHGRGLLRRTTLTPTARATFTFTFERRGHHPPFALEQCAACHPVSSEGARHGLTQYPPEVREVALVGGRDCAATCHVWLPTNGSEQGFTPAQGSAPRVDGNLRPHELLSAAKDAHGAIYLSGYVKPAAQTGIRLGRINPGCAGCHGLRNDKHGSMPGCLDCHDFRGSSGPLHEAHVTAISLGRDRLDPGNAQQSGCTYCHGAATPTPLKNAACYSCHLSGHQVRDPQSGKAHFWQL